MISEIKDSISNEFITERIPPRFLIKFGAEEHLRMLQQGKLYMNSWQYFKACEKHDERTDTNEGVHFCINPSKTRILIADRILSREGGTLNATVAFFDKKTKIFCASALWNNDEVKTDEIFDHRIKDFGDAFIVIMDIKGFFRKLSCSLKNLHLDSKIETSDARRVRYFDEDSYDGEVGPFRKTLQYAHQREWRLAIQTAQENDEPFILNIGSIENICMLGKTKNFKNAVDSKIENCLSFLF